MAKIAVLHNEANIGTNSSYYYFKGTTLTKNVDNGWLLNDAGDTFKYVICQERKELPLLFLHSMHISC